MTSYTSVWEVRRPRAFCIMSLRVTLYGKVNPFRKGGAEAKACLNRASESCGVDPKPGDLPMARVKFW